MFESYKSLRNELDFFLRKRLRLGRAVDPKMPTPENELQFQKEIAEFLLKIELAKFLKLMMPTAPIRVLDVGCRNFSTGIVIDGVLSNLSIGALVDGIEVDAGRRLSDFRTRGDWGRYFAAKIRSGRYFEMDFRQWHEPADLIFVLNPFVENSTTLEWGLPTRYSNVNPLMEHAHRLLRDNGLLVLSSPTEEDWTFLDAAAIRAGFEPMTEARIWEPSSVTIQKQKRIGNVWKKSPAHDSF